MKSLSVLTLSLTGWFCLPALTTAGSTSAGDTAGPKMQLSVSQLNFGRLARGRSAVKEIEIFNSGDDALRLRRVGVNCDCASLKLSTPRRLNVPIDTQDEGKVQLALPPGESATLRVSVDTSGLPLGVTSKRCLIYSNDKSKSPATVPLSFTVEEIKPATPTSQPRVQPPTTPVVNGRLRTDREEHAFGQVLRGERPTCTFTLTNEGPEALTLRNVRNSCSCTASRMWLGDRVIEGDQLTATQELGTLPAGETCKLEIELETKGFASRSSQPQSLRKSVRVFHDGHDNPVNLNITAEVAEPATFDPITLRFGKVRRNQESELSTILKPERIEGFQITGAKPTKPEALAVRYEPVEQPAGGYKITITVKPNAPLGPAHGPVTLALDHPQVKELQVPVALEIGPNVVFTGSDPQRGERLDFGILTGESSSLDLTIENFDADTPYEPKVAELTARPTATPFTHELIEVEKGQKYIVRLTVSNELSARYFNGKLRLEADHPDVPVKLIDFRGWLKKTAPPPGE